jgi:serine protease Do
MTQTEAFSFQPTSHLPDIFSTALVDIFQCVQPSIVQVHTEGRGAGTGIIWDTKGHIITNHHVVAREGARVQVFLSDGRTLDARVLQSNPSLDLALLQANGENLQAIPIADSTQLRVGEWLFAVGHPWGQRWVVTAGIMSGIATVRNNSEITYIKSDVRLAPGNSGGPLLNADGEVVGINAMIFGGDLSVSIPSRTVTTWLKELTKRTVKLGVAVQGVPIADLPSDVQHLVTPQRASGLLIVGIEEQQAATSLLLGDILLDIAGTPVENAASLREQLAQQQEQATFPLTLLRAGKKITLDIKPIVGQLFS